MNLPRLISSLSLVIAAAHAAAATDTTVYRCGPDGRSYSAQPCSGGVRVDVADARQDTQRAHARDVVARDQALAKTLREQRREREAAHPQLAAGILSRHDDLGAKGAHHVALKKKGRKEDDAAGANPTASGSQHRRSSRVTPRDPRVTYEIRLPKPPKPKAASPKARVKA
jgi:hypothetical protein